MSILSGFIGTIDGEEVFAVTWKNYMDIDGFIWGFCFDNHLAFDNHLVRDPSKDEHLTLIFHNYDAFEKVCLALDQRIKKGFTEEDVMMHSVEDAKYQWEYIMDKIFTFIDFHDDGYLNKITFEFFSCN